jgi:hypothetical protein
MASVCVSVIGSRVHNQPKTQGGNSGLKDFKTSKDHETSIPRTSNFQKTSKDFKRLQRSSKDFMRLHETS